MFTRGAHSSCLVILLLLVGIVSVRSNWCDGVLDKVLGRFKKEADCKKEPPPKIIKSHEACDQNVIMGQLARLYINSPERIVQLLNAHELDSVCTEVEDVLQNCKNSLSTCQPLSSNNLYMKLLDGLTFFDTHICKRPPKQHNVADHQNCLKEMREDFIDCEGPAFWFEKNNKTIVCPMFADIVNCHYIKAAILCGLKSAKLLRSFAGEVMGKVLEVKCPIKRSPPHVEDPMPSRAECLLQCSTRIEKWPLLYNNKAIYYYIIFLIVDSLR